MLFITYCYNFLGGVSKTSSAFIKNGTKINRLLLILHWMEIYLFKIGQKCWFFHFLFQLWLCVFMRSQWYQSRPPRWQRSWESTSSPWGTRTWSPKPEIKLAQKLALNLRVKSRPRIALYDLSQPTRLVWSLFYVFQNTLIIKMQNTTI